MDSANAFSSLHLSCIPGGKKTIKRIDRQMLQLQESKRTLLTKYHTRTHVRSNSQTLSEEEEKRAKVKL